MICIGRESQCLPYAGFFFSISATIPTQFPPQPEAMNSQLGNYPCYSLKISIINCNILVSETFCPTKIRSKYLTDLVYPWAVLQTVLTLIN